MMFPVHFAKLQNVIRKILELAFSLDHFQHYLNNYWIDCNEFLQTLMFLQGMLAC